MEVSIPYDVRVDPASITHRFAINLIRVCAEVVPRMRKAEVINYKCFHVVWAEALPRSGSFETYVFPVRCIIWQPIVKARIAVPHFAV
jgi:hypothetical protein